MSSNKKGEKEGAGSCYYDLEGAALKFGLSLEEIEENASFESILCKIAPICASCKNVNLCRQNDGAGFDENNPCLWYCQNFKIFDYLKKRCRIH